ncbi:MAG: hypothetical protein MUC83_17205 [Pirellula sp.]|jgi:hypothetical protein|nr:hypothetical protein [Pirellula sp.]
MMIALTQIRAFMWEMSKNWHVLLLGFLGGVLPLFLFLWLLTSVGLPVQSPEFIRTHTFLMPLTFLALFLGIVGTQGPVRRLYSYPLSDSTIALWHMLTGIVMISAGCSLIIQWLNLQFRAGWPILGPTLYFAMAFAVLQPYSRIAYKTVSTIVTIPVVVLILIFGFLSRYSVIRSQPKLWSELSPLEICILAGVTFGATFLFIRSVTLDRHNLGKSDPLVEWWIRGESWIRSRLPQFGNFRFEPRDGFAAHCWFLWKLTRSLFYLNVVLAFLAFIIFATTTERGAISFEFRFVFSGAHWFPIILSTVLAATLGIGLGSSNADSTPSRDKVTFEEKLRSMNLLTMGSFVATLPISNTRLSNAILLIAFRGVFTSVLLTLISAGALCLFGLDLVSNLWQSGLLDVYCLLLLALPWSVVGVTSTVCLIGRNRFLIAYWFSGIVVIALVGFPSTRPITIFAFAWVATLTNFALLAERNDRMKRQYGTSQTAEDRWQVGFAVVLWLVLLAFSWQMPLLRSAESFGVGYLLLSSASVTPIIAMPLAISVNRTR